LSSRRAEISSFAAHRIPWGPVGQSLRRITNGRGQVIGSEPSTSIFNAAIRGYEHPPASEPEAADRLTRTQSTSRVAIVQFARPCPAVLEAGFVSATVVDAVELIRIFPSNRPSPKASATAADVAGAFRRSRQFLDALLALQSVFDILLRWHRCLRRARGDKGNGDVLEHANLLSLLFHGSGNRRQGEKSDRTGPPQAKSRDPLAERSTVATEWRHHHNEGSM
jgi:hypothetical protein